MSRGAAFDRLHPALQHHIVNSLGWRELRPVQELGIEAIFQGANVVVLAPTAGGKTEAAFFPLISRTLEEDRRGLSVLYLSPIRALLNNQEERLRRYYGLVGRRIGVWHGDTAGRDKKAALAEPPDCLLTTPESLEVLLVSKKVDHERLLGSVREVVIDEVHAFASDDRGWHLLALLARIGRLAGRDLQRVGLSATVGNPEHLLDWLAAGSERPRRVLRGDVTTPPTEDASEAAAAARKPVAADVQLDWVGTLANAAKVIHALHRGEKRLVFIDSRARVESLAAELRALDVRTFVSHSSLGVDERRQAEHAFAEAHDCVIVATSALELGIDVGDLDRVIQIDAPSTVSSFLQRMGRTGRRPGTERNCLFLATSDDGLLKGAAIIELWRSGFVEPVEPPPTPLHILAQQILALALQEHGIGRTAWRDWLRGVAGFDEISDERANAMLAHMLGEKILWDDEGILWFGEEGEKTYGRKNWLELLSVFTSPPLFKVMRGRDELGTVHESTFTMRQGGDDPGSPVILLLGGRSWKLRSLDWKRRIAHVEPTDEKGRSRWRGEGQALRFELCQKIREVLTSDDVPDHWSRRARGEMARLREEYGFLKQAGAMLSAESGAAGENESAAETRGATWWTFAGGRANAALADAMAKHLGSAAHVRADNLAVRVKGSVNVAEIAAAIDAIRKSVIEDGAELALEIDPRAPAGLKFSECLAREEAEGVLRARLRDARAVVAVLGG